MRFRTEIAPVKPPFYIDYHHPVMMIGSCFTDNIGTKLQEHLFTTSINPFGVTYNPLSIDRSLANLIFKDKYVKEELDFHNELYFSFDHYTKFSDIDQDAVLKKINTRFESAKKIIKSAGTLILTFGTAYTYRYLKTNEVVNNCHKIPASEFSREILSVDEIYEKLSASMKKLFGINPKINIVLTVSPVRHLKDGHSGNQRSKSTLILASEKIEKDFPGRCFYFPSYEIMMDDLRDYRFYSPDMLHPNEQAIDYIWNVFSKSFSSEETTQIIKKITPLIKSLHHRPLQQNTGAYKKFRKQLDQEKQKLKESFPFLNWSELP